MGKVYNHPKAASNATVLDRLVLAGEAFPRKITPLDVLKANARNEPCSGQGAMNFENQIRLEFAVIVGHQHAAEMETLRYPPL